MKTITRITAAFNYRCPEWSVLGCTFWLLENSSVARGKYRIYQWKPDVMAAEEIMIMCIILKRYLSHFYLKILYVGRFYDADMHFICKWHNQFIWTTLILNLLWAGNAEMNSLSDSRNYSRWFLPSLHQQFFKFFLQDFISLLCTYWEFSLDDLKVLRLNMPKRGKLYWDQI